MKPEATIFERNLELLLRHAYVPVRPTAAFRRSLAQVLDATRQARAPQATQLPHVGHGGETRVDQLRVGRTRRRSAWPIAAALAAGVLAVFFAQRLFMRSAAPDLAQLLADGRVGVRVDGGAWRSASEREVEQGLDFESSALAVATSATSGARVWLASNGKLELGRATQVEIHADAQLPAPLSIVLERGALTLERYAAGASWRIETAHASFELERGVLELSYERDELSGAADDSVRALLRTGAAQVALQSERSALVVGQAASFRRGVLVASATASTPQASQRASLPTATQTAAAAGTPARTPTVSLHGVLTYPPPLLAAATHPTRARVTLLPRVELPSVAQPITRELELAGDAFTFTGAEPGSYAVFVQVQGCAVWCVRELALLDVTQPVELAIALEPPARIRGRIVDAASGAPIEGALVLSEPDAPTQLLELHLASVPEGFSAATRSAADGSFELGALGSGTQLLRANCKGYAATWSEQLVLAPGALLEGLELRLVRGGRVHGRVAHDDGKPWPGAIVIVSALETNGERSCMSYGIAFADAAGEYAVDDLPSGQYVVLNVFEAGGASVSPRVMQVSLKAPADLVVDLPPQVRGTRLHGRLSDSAGQALASYDITVAPCGSSEGWQSQRTNADGVYTFPDLPARTFEVFVGRGMGRDYFLQQEIEITGAPEQELALRADQGVIEGHVKVDVAGAALPSVILILEVQRDGAWVFAGRSMTHADGSFELRPLPLGLYRLGAYALNARDAASHPAAHYGQEHAEDLWLTSARPTTNFEFTLRPGAALTLVVHDALGRPLSDASLALRSATGERVQFSSHDQSDAHGRFVIDGIQPGRWTVHAEHAGYSPLTSSFDLDAGEERELVLVLTELAREK